MEDLTQEMTEERLDSPVQLISAAFVAAGTQTQTTRSIRTKRVFNDSNVMLCTQEVLKCKKQYIVVTRLM